MYIIMDKSIETNLRKYLLISVFSSMLFFVPITVIFLQDIGLSMAEILVLESIFGVTLIILEIPTGAFADRHGRKTSVALSFLMIAAANLIFSMGQNFYHFLAAQLLWGIGISLESGAGSALLYDTLVQLKREKSYNRVLGRNLAVGEVTLAISTLSAGFIAAISFRLVFIMTAATAFIAFLVCTSLVEPRRERHPSYIKNFTGALGYVRKHKILLWLMVYFSVTVACGVILYWLEQPWMREAGFSIEQFGVIIAFATIVSALGARLADPVERRIGLKPAIYLLFLLPFISIVAMAYSLAQIVALTFIFSGLGTGLSYALIDSSINRYARSIDRATILSINSLMQRLVFIVMAPFLGVIADAYDIQTALFASAILMLVAAHVIIAVYLIARRRSKRPKGTYRASRRPRASR